MNKAIIILLGVIFSMLGTSVLLSTAADSTYRQPSALSQPAISHSSPTVQSQTPAPRQKQTATPSPAVANSKPTTTAKPIIIGPTKEYYDNLYKQQEEARRERDRIAAEERAAEAKRQEELYRIEWEREIHRENYEYNNFLANERIRHDQAMTALNNAANCGPNAYCVTGSTEQEQAKHESNLATARATHERRLKDIDAKYKALLATIRR